MTKTITAIIPAANEEKNVARCLKSVSWCDEVMVITMGHDKTGEIARKEGATVIEKNKSETDDFVKVQENVNYAVEKARGEWILRIDADEVVTEELKQEILALLESASPFVAFGIPRKQYFWGGFLKGGDWAYDRLVRLFKKGTARYEPIVFVHEQFKVNGPVGYLKHPLEHYSHPTLDVAVGKFNSYTSRQIKDMHESYGSAVFKMFTQPPYIFLRWMIWHRGWRDGLRGIIAGIFRAWYEFMLYAKYLEFKEKK